MSEQAGRRERPEPSYARTIREVARAVADQREMDRAIAREMGWGEARARAAITEKED